MSVDAGGRAHLMPRRRHPAIAPAPGFPAGPERPPESKPQSSLAALAVPALSALHVGVLLLDGDAGVEWANAAARRMLDDADSSSALAGEAWRAIERLAGAAAEGHDAPRLLELALGGETLLVRAVRLASPGHGAARRAVLVTLERAPDRGPTDAELRERYGLTPRELRVARLVADGLSNAALAAALGITVNTARAHTERVRRKMGVRSRARIVALLHGAADRADP